MKAKTTNAAGKASLDPLVRCVMHTACPSKDRCRHAKPHRAGKMCGDGFICQQYTFTTLTRCDAPNNSITGG